MSALKSSWGQAVVLTAGLIFCGPGGGAVPLLAQEPELPALTMEEAIEAALRHSPQMAQALGAVENAGHGQRTAWGAYLPSLSASSGGSRRSSEIYNPTTGAMDRSAASVGYNAGLSSSIDLFTGGRRGADSNRARADAAAADAGLIQQRFAVILNTKRAYFEVLKADELIRVSAARLERAQEALDAAERRAQVGSATQSDVLRAQLEVTNARQALLQARNQKTNGGFALGRLVGRTGAVGAKPTGPIEIEPRRLDHEALAAEILRQAPAVRSASASADAAAASARAARSQYLPTVSASGGYNLSNNEISLGTSNKSWNLGVSLSYPIFNRFQREANVGRANVQADIAAAQLADAQRAARADLERVLGALELAQEQVALTEEAVRVAEEDLRLQQERYRLGVSTILDQVTSQGNLVQAEVNRINARFDFQTALAELEALLGREL
jgi:outer membrane protein TolC